MAREFETRFARLPYYELVASACLRWRLCFAGICGYLRVFAGAEKKLLMYLLGTASIFLFLRRSWQRAGAGWPVE